MNLHSGKRNKKKINKIFINEISNLNQQIKHFPLQNTCTANRMHIKMSNMSYFNFFLPPTETKCTFSFTRANIKDFPVKIRKL